MNRYARPCTCCGANITSKTMTTHMCRSCSQKNRWQNELGVRLPQRIPDDFVEQMRMDKGIRHGSKALIDAIRREHPERLAA